MGPSVVNMPLAAVAGISLEDYEPRGAAVDEQPVAHEAGPHPLETTAAQLEGLVAQLHLADSAPGGAEQGGAPPYNYRLACDLLSSTGHACELWREVLLTTGRAGETSSAVQLRWV